MPLKCLAQGFVHGSCQVGGHYSISTVFSSDIITQRTPLFLLYDYVTGCSQREAPNKDL